MKDRDMSPEQRVDGVVLEYLLQADLDDHPRCLERITQDTGLPSRVVAGSTQRLYGLGWIRWTTVPFTGIAGWRLTDTGAMAATDYPRPYYRDPDGCIGDTRRVEPGEDEWCVDEVILTPREYAALPEV